MSDPTTPVNHLEREIQIAKAEIHAVMTADQLESAVEDLMRLAYRLGQAALVAPPAERTRRRCD